MAGFETADRGKLIMACGTGKTFTSLKIAEQFPKANNLILFLVPSISLLSQTLREWTAESEINFHSIAVGSDTKVGKNKRKSKNDDMTCWMCWKVNLWRRKLEVWKSFMTV
uniref:DEAD/DEAH box helicase family protein n=1 Tax=Okeania sp. SIO2F4 TaxID=2607790 RepID=UPI0025F5A35A|nr:DEAD/DEAH box helicase family protein [Okeania sp. SIO2F4]